MASATSATKSSAAPHRWRFFRSGGFDQVRLDTGADIVALDQLDQKLWAALSCPVRGLEFDTKTLQLIDTDEDGRIRVPEIIAAAKWAGALLKNPDDLTKGAEALPLSAIDDSHPEGVQLLASARQILLNLGKADNAEITLEDTADTAKIFAQTRFNGDGVIPPDAAEDGAVRAVIEEVMGCVGAETDRCGAGGLSQPLADQFFAEAQAYSDWWTRAEGEAATVLPLGEATHAAVEALRAVQAKVEDYFTRCRLAAFDPRAAVPLNPADTVYGALAPQALSAAVEEVAALPLALIEAGKPLPLTGGLNPAWAGAMARLKAEVLQPLLGERTSLTADEWSALRAKLAPYEAWAASKAGGGVETLGLARVREILAGSAREAIAGLIAKDKALEPEANAIASVDRLVRYHRDLYALLNNFVALRDFYTRKAKATFQAGTLYLDGRSCELCVRVGDPAKHGALATLSRTYLAYCDCTRRGSTEKMTIAAAFTGGDSDNLMVGRNGVFYDRKGQDWDATIVKIIDNPISIRQAFWSPYKKLVRLIADQAEKLAAARSKGVEDRAAAGVADAGKAVDAGKAPGAAPFDVAKFAGIFAAIGLAVGAIGTAIAALVTGFLKLAWWQMPLAIIGLMLVVSGPAVILAWLKLRQRNLGPILDANGWAVNIRAKLNVPFGGALTAVAKLPPGSERSDSDPFAEKKRPWALYLIIVVILVAAVLLWMEGLIPWSW